MRTITLVVLGLAGLAAHPASAQSLAARISEVREGTVRFSFKSRPDVCGSGEHSIQTGSGRHFGTWNSDDVSRSDCVYGPVHLRVTRSGGTVTRIGVTVGAWAGTGGTSLGMVSTREAAAWLMALARNSETKAGGEAMFAVTLADSVTPWPEMLAIARDASVRQDTRKQAVFWLGQAAGDAATKGLTELAEDDDGDREVRESAVFALSQLKNDQGVPALVRIARSNGDPRIRRTALFWLGQSEDPRALDLFEELLVRQ